MTDLSLALLQSALVYFSLSRNDSHVFSTTEKGRETELLGSTATGETGGGDCLTDGGTVARFCWVRRGFTAEGDDAGLVGWVGDGAGTASELGCRHGWLRQRRSMRAETARRQRAVARHDGEKQRTWSCCKARLGNVKDAVMGGMTAA
ncbi:hypothetical protein M0R45_025819 [Rubus argutus]|uniref:MHC class I antigen n=1 Tax=Rubus argutus TaxID=59490 RepID=A0AAW1WVQ9_RUBAR